MKKTTIILLLLTIINCDIALSQNSDWLWANSFGGLNYDQSNAITTDSIGNFYSVGNFNSEIINFDNFSLSRIGQVDVFTTKHSSDGSILWARRFGGVYVENGLCIAADRNNFIYFAGNFTSDTIYAGSDTLVKEGLTDFFITKYDSSGNQIWSKQFGGPKFDLCYDLSLDQFSNLYITGFFTSDTLVLGNDTLINQNEADIFIAKLDSLGNFIWAKSAGGNNRDIGRNISVNSNSEVVISGQFNSDYIEFENNMIYNTTNETGDSFIAKYDSNGNLIWVNKLGGNLDETSSDIAFDRDNNLFVTGTFSSNNLLLDTLTFLNTGNNKDIFLAKYNNNGNIIWAKTFESITYYYFPKITIDNSNNVYLGCTFESDFWITNNDTIRNEGLINIILNKISSSGNLIWSRGIGGTGALFFSDIVTNHSNNLFISGNLTSSTATIGSIYFQNQDTTGVSSDIFFASLSPLTNLFNLESKSKNDLMVFPNPTSGDLLVTIPKNTSEIRIYNSLGQLEQRKNIKGETTMSFRIDKNGIFIVTAMASDKIFSAKIIVTD